MAVQIDAYNKKFKTNYNYIIPCNLYGEFDKFGDIEGHFVGALIEKIIEAKKNKKIIFHYLEMELQRDNLCMQKIWPE